MQPTDHMSTASDHNIMLQHMRQLDYWQLNMQIWSDTKACA